MGELELMNKGKEHPDQDALKYSLLDLEDLISATRKEADTAAHALKYAALGWPVVPCRHANVHGGQAKAAYGGLRAATTDPDSIRRAWKARPKALIGAVPPAGHIVIDLDPRAGGTVEALATLCGGTIPDTLVSETGRGDGGRHYWFTTTRQDLMQRSLADGIDTRLHGKGVVIVPPSQHPATGGPYTWLTASAPACLPRELESALVPRAAPMRRPYRARGARAYMGLIDARMATARAGQRNGRLYSIARKFHEEGQPPAAFKALAVAAIGTGLAAAEVERTLKSAHAGFDRSGGVNGLALQA